MKTKTTQCLSNLLFETIAAIEWQEAFLTQNGRTDAPMTSSLLNAKSNLLSTMALLFPAMTDDRKQPVDGSFTSILWRLETLKQMVDDLCSNASNDVFAATYKNAATCIENAKSDISNAWEEAKRTLVAPTVQQAFPMTNELILNTLLPH